MDVENAFHTAIMQTLQKLAPAGGVVDFIPPLSRSYPVIHLERTQIITAGGAKEKLNARAVAVVSVWGKQTKRGDVSKLTASSLTALSNLTTLSQGLHLVYAPSRSSFEIMSDTSTPELLWRGRIKAEWLLY